MVKLILILIILILIAVFRIIRSVVRTVSNELPFWTEAAGKVLNEFIEEGKEANSNGEATQTKRTIELNYRSDFEEKIDQQIARFGKFIDENCETNLHTFQFLEFCISMHMAKADGVIDVSEIDGIRSYFKETYGKDLDETLLAKASPLVREYIQSYEPDELILSACLSLEVWIEVLKDVIRGEEEQHEFIFQIFSFVYQVALMDGSVANSELRFFKGICEFFGFDEETEEYIKRSGEYQFNARKNKSESINREEKEIENALKLFQLKSDFSKAELQTAWKNFAKLNHPDRFHNVDAKLYKAIHEQFLEAKKGYELLLSLVETKPQSPFVEPEVKTEEKKEEVKTPPPQPEKESPKENVYSYANVQRENYGDSVENTTPSMFWAEMKERLINISLILKKTFSVENLKMVFFGTKSRTIISISIPLFVIMGILITPYAVGAFYRSLLKKDSISDYKKARNYFYLQGDSSIDLMKDIFKNSESDIEKTNALHVLIEMDDSSSDTRHYAMEMLSKEDSVALHNLENISTLKFYEESFYNSILSLLQRKNNLLRERAVALLNKKGISSNPVSEENKSLFLNCKNDSVSSVRLYCIQSLMPYANEKEVMEVAIQGIKNNSADIRNFSWKIIFEGISSPNNLDEIITANNNHPLKKLLIENLEFYPVEILKILAMNPKYLKSNFAVASKFLRTREEGEVLGFLQNVEETLLKEAYFQVFLSDISKGKSDEFRSIYSPEANTSKPAMEKSTQIPQQSPVSYARVKEPSGLFLRSICSMRGDKLVLIPDRERVEVLERDKEDFLYGLSNHWYRVRYDGKEGCSFGAFLEF